MGWRGRGDEKGWGVRCLQRSCLGGGVLSLSETRAWMLCFLQRKQTQERRQAKEIVFKIQKWVPLLKNISLPGQKRPNRLSLLFQIWLGIAGESLEGFNVWKKIWRGKKSYHTFSLVVQLIVGSFNTVLMSSRWSHWHLMGGFQKSSPQAPARSGSDLNVLGRQPGHQDLKRLLKYF